MTIIASLVQKVLNAQLHLMHLLIVKQIISPPPCLFLALNAQQATNAQAKKRAKSKFVQLALILFLEKLHAQRAIKVSLNLL